MEPTRKKRPSARSVQLHPRGLSPRKRGPAVVAMTVYVPQDAARRLRVRAAEDGRTVSSLVVEALGRELS
jgi:hypothetical protein